MKRRGQQDNAARYEFPPVNSGGLIEASKGMPCLSSIPKFPPVNSGGLIEAPRR